MYDQNSVNSMLLMQKKQMMWMMAMFFAVMVAAVIFSTFLINNVVNSRMASAHSSQPQVTPTVYVQPSNSSATTTGCSQPEGGQGGEDHDGQVLGASAGGGTWAMIGGRGGEAGHGHAAVGGRGGDVTAGGGSTVTYTITKHSTRNVNSNNVLGSHNGNGNTATTHNTQGSYNTVDGNLHQLNLAKNEAENESKVIIKDSSNTEDSNNNEVEIKDSGNDNSVDNTSESTTHTETHVNSHNTIDAVPVWSAS